MRTWQGPALFSYGFRPFFLGAAAYAAIAMVLWIGIVTDAWSIPSTYDPVAWHAHEFLWGYLSAVIAGFLLTAIPNWTGRLPIVGVPLAILWSIWVLGRLAMFGSTGLPVEVSAAIDTAFLITLALVVAREIIAGRNWHNLMVLGVLSIFIAGNVVFHFQAISGENAAHGIGVRIGVAAAVLLIAIVGGRIVPSFTRNWLAKRGGRLPAQFGWVDKAVLAVSLFALAAWVANPELEISGYIATVAGFANFYRLARWVGWRCFSEPLVAILHVGYLFVPIGFVLTGISTLYPELVPQAAALHAWTAGAFTIMTLAVMTRASLGHTGRLLVASKPVSAIYLFAIIAATARIAAGITPAIPWLLEIAGLAWIMAFVGFVVVYAPLLAKPRTG
jgi:uncharacterized protein involved in response to NO